MSPCLAQSLVYSAPQLEIGRSSGNVDVPIEIIDSENRVFRSFQVAVQIDSPYLSVVSIADAFGDPSFQYAEAAPGGWYLSVFYDEGLPANSIDDAFVVVTCELDACPVGTLIPMSFGAVSNASNSASTVEDDVLEPTLQHGYLNISGNFVRGDVNADEVISLADMISLLNYLFLEGPIASCAEAMDANSDGVAALTDVLTLANFSFLRGTPPGAPFPNCGPTEVFELSCQIATCP